MFCGNCGKEINTKFCTYCGMEFKENSVAPQTHQEINAITYDELKSMFGYNKIAAVKYVKDQTDQSLSDAKAMVDDLYKTNKPTFAKRFAEQANEISQAKLEAKKTSKHTLLKERIKQMNQDGVAYCPKCYSTSLSANKKGFGIGKSVISGMLGATVAAPFALVGLTAGNIGAKKVRVTCLKCGKQFWAGKR